MHIIYVCVLGEQAEKEIPTDSTGTVYTSNSGSLILSKVEASMKGVYTCEADNGFGKPLKKRILISVKGKMLKVLADNKIFAKQASCLITKSLF